MHGSLLSRVATIAKAMAAEEHVDRVELGS